MKNKYRVFKIIEGSPVEHSTHNNWDYALIWRDQLRNQGISSMIMYRGHIVEEDVKKIKPMREGI